MATGGSLVRVSLRGRRFSVPGETDTNRELGGFNNTITVNGDGSPNSEKKRVPGCIENLELSINDIRKDQEFIQALADASGFFPVVVEYADGTKYSGSLAIDGKIVFSSMAAKATLNLKGSELVQQ